MERRMKKNDWDIPELDPEKVKEEKAKPFVSKGYQYYRDEVLRIFKYFAFSEKFKIIKSVDRDLLSRLNTYTGTKAVHTLDYIHKIPSRKKDLTLKDETILLLRSLSMLWAREDYYNKRRKKIIRVIK